jgi:hypothetical protein
MESQKKRRWTYVAAAIIGAIILILAIILMQQPIQNKATPPSISAPSVTTAEATGVTQTAATLNGNLASLGTASSVSVGFRFGTGSNPAADTNVSVGTKATVTPFSWSLTGLTPATAYHVTAWALGDGFALGFVIQFTTQTSSGSETVPPFVTTEQTSAVGPSNATLNGNLSDLGTASSVTVGFLYGTDAGLAGATNVTVGGMDAAGAFQTDATGLASNTTYYVEAWALGDGFANGSTESFTTATSPGSETAPPFVTTLNATCIRSSKATLHGNLTDLGTALNVTVGFLYSTNANLTGATNVTLGVINTTGAFWLRAPDLAQNTTYYVQAWALGDGFANGSVVSFHTPSRECGAHHHGSHDWGREGKHGHWEGCGHDDDHHGHDGRHHHHDKGCRVRHR